MGMEKSLLPFRRLYPLEHGVGIKYEKLL